MRDSPSGNVELTFLGHPFESLGRVLDPILAIIAVGRKQPDHFIGAAGGRTRDVARSKIDSLSDGKFVLQRPLHHARTPAVLTVPLQQPTENPCGAYITGPDALTSYIGTYQIRGFCRFFSAITALSATGGEIRPDPVGNRFRASKPYAG